MRRPLLIKLNRRRAPLHRVAESARLALTDIEAQLQALSSRSQKGTVLPRVEQLLGMMDTLLASEHGSEEHTNVTEEAKAACFDAAMLFRAVDVQRFDTDKALQRLRGIGRALDQAKDLSFLVSDDDPAAPLDVLPEPQNLQVAVGEPRLHFPEREAARLRFDAEAEIHRGPIPEAVSSPLASATLFDVLPDEPTEARFDEEIPEDKRLEVLTEDGRAAQQASVFVSGRDGEIAALKLLIRDCLEEINACANLRRLTPAECYDWTAMRGFEQRMLSALDALLAYGTPFFSADGSEKARVGLDIVAETIAYAEDAPTIDPGRSFAAAFVLSSIAGPDCARAAVALLKRSHPDTHRAQAQALSLVDNPDVVTALREMLNGDEPAYTSVALDALYAAGKLNLVDVAPLSEHSHHALRLRAIRSLGACPESTAVCALLRDIAENDMDDEVVLVSVQALFAQGDGDGLLYVRERLQEELEAPTTLTTEAKRSFLEFLSVVGDPSDFELLAGHYGASVGSARALGFSGDARFVDLLLADLAPLNAEDARFVTSTEGEEVARALLRITGAPLLRSNERPSRYEPSLDAARWRTWWEQNRALFDETRRYRFGEPHSPTHALAELLASDVPMGLREICAVELGFACKQRPLLLHPFAAQQARSLEACRQQLVAMQEESA